MTKNVDFLEINKNLSLNDMDGETWLDVVGYEGLYMVSCFGRVKSLGRMKKSKNGELTSSVRERIMSAHSDKDGYRII
jgi:NUMOD4 motif